MRRFSPAQLCLALAVLVLLPGIAGAADPVPPVAGFTADITSGMVPLEVTFTDTSTNSLDGRAWFFGDENYTAAWTQVRENNAYGWPGRLAATAVVTLNGTVLVMGGTDYSSTWNDTWASVDNGVTWSQVNASAGWSPRGSFSGVVLPDGSIVIMGGGQQWSTDCKNDVWRSTDNGVTWVQQNANAGWTKRWGHTSVALPDGSIVLMGGVDNTYAAKRDVWRSTDKGVTWTQMTPNAGWVNGQQSSSVALPDGTIVLLGGGGGGYGWVNEVWKSSDKGATWTQLPNAGWAGRGAHTSVVMPDGSIVLMGGTDARSDVWRSSDGGTSWTQLPDAAWPGREAHMSVVASDGSILVMGGTLENDVWRLAPVGSVAVNPSHTYTEPGSYTVALRAYNTGGFNTSRQAGFITASPPPAPTVTGVTPASVLANGSATRIVNITGTGFSAGSAVLLNRTGYADIRGTGVTMVSPTQITCTFNLSTAMTGQYTIVVTDRLGQAGMLADGFTIVPPPPPKVTGITPDTGANQSAFSITNLSGKFFAAGATVMLNRTGYADIPGTGVTIVSPAKITCTFNLATAATGRYNIVVTDRYNQSGMLAEGFTVNKPSGPVAAFSGISAAGNRSGIAPLNIMFSDASTGDPAGWAWFFGDENYQQAWTDVWAGGGSPFPSRAYHSSVAMPDGSVVLMGGLRSQYLNDTWRSVDNGVTWTRMSASAGWSKRVSPASVAMPDGTIVLMGGVDENYATKNDVWKSTDNGATWTLVNARAGWAARTGPAGVVMPDGSIVLMGGSTFGGGTNFNDVWRSTDKGVTWTKVTPGASWQGRAGSTSVVMPDGSIVLMGGFVSSGGIFYNDTWRSTDGGATWTRVTANAGWAARQGHTSVAMPDGSIVLMGGQDSSGNYLNDVWRSKDNGVTWTELPAPGWTGRYGHTSVVLRDGSILLMSGFGNDGLMSVEWRLSPAGSVVQNPSHTYTAPGSYAVTLQAYNPMGYNSTKKTGYITVTQLPPLFTDITPKSGSTNGGTPVTIRGARFAAGGVFGVKIGGIAATNVTRINATTITAKTPVHTAGATNIVVTNNDGQIAAKDAAYTYIVPPAITSITPKSGTTKGNTLVTIRGAGFTSGGSFGVTIGGIAATNVTRINATTITAKTPAHTAGATNIVVTNNDGQTAAKTAAYTYIAPPAITSITPKSGTTNGGTPVTIRGTGFASGGSFGVTIGGIAAKNVTRINATTITAKTPAHTAGATNIVVTNNDGQTAAKAAAYTYIAPPAITSITPKSGTTKGNTLVTIRGTGFASGGSFRVTIGGIAAKNVTRINAATITAKTPAHIAGATNIVVTNNDGQTAVRARAYTYVAPPAVTKLTPATGKRGATVQIADLAGTGFIASPKPAVQLYRGAVTINATNITVVSTKKITCTIRIPASATAGPWNAKVTNADKQAGVKASAFTVTI